jgi:hypothetical protein
LSCLGKQILGFVGDGAPAVIDENNGVASKLKKK